ncbi:MAG: electron transport complex subunit RsxC [Oscillospiraceae bacterium]|jgi:electron transport complex protein RnfC
MPRRFFGGLHPDDHKAATNKKPIEILPPPDEVVLPMSMHIGAPCKVLVQKGDSVKMGQTIGEAASAISAPVHASVSGTVKAVEPRLHPNGSMVMSVVIENDHLDTPAEELKQYNSIDDISPEEIINVVKAAGIVGLGGATFPTHFKISSGIGKVDTIIINGAECEPYITSDHRLMLEHTQEILDGVRLLIKSFGLSRAYIAVEKNKPDAIEALQAALGGAADITVLPLKTRYPQGAEKQLIQSVTGREVPSGGLPAAVGCAVFNIDTTAAVARAVYGGTPVIRRIVTVSGSAVTEPKNLNVRLGTPLSAVFEAAGGFKQEARKILMGGPMMGVAQFDLGVPVIKSTNALLAFGEKESRVYQDPTCIRCGKCVGVCPIRLMPVKLNLYASKNMYSELEACGINDCIECGSCAYICPGRLPLVHTFRMAKQKLADHKKAEAARKEAQK